MFWRWPRRPARAALAALALVAAAQALETPNANASASAGAATSATTTTTPTSATTAVTVPTPAVVPTITTTAATAASAATTIELEEQCAAAVLSLQAANYSLQCATAAANVQSVPLSSSVQVKVNSFGHGMSISVEGEAPIVKELSVESTALGQSSVTITDVTGLTALETLSFSKTTFADPSLMISASRTLKTISLRDTSATELELNVPESSLLRTVVLKGNLAITKVPKILYQRIYSRTITLQGPPNFTLSEPTRLTRAQYNNVTSNLHGVNDTYVAFIGNCNGFAASFVHLVCYVDGEAAAASSSSSGGKASTAKTSRGSSTDTLLTIVVIVLGVLTAVTGTFVTRRYFCAPATSSSPTNDPSVGLISKDEMPREPMSFIASDDILRQIRLSQQAVTLTKPVGTGRLWLGEFENHKVMIKRVETESTDRHVTRELVAQARTLAEVSHPNVSNLLGVTWIQGTDFGIVAEFVDRGTLKAVLTDIECDLDLVTKLRMCLDVAQALAYLHSDSTNMYVKRLSSHRVLVTSTLTCKLNLFDCYPSSVPLCVPEVFGTGEMAWWAPELVLRRSTDDPYAANVFSLGVLMCEIFTRLPPYAALTDEVGHTLADVELRVRARRQESLVPHENHRDFIDAPSEVRELISQCLSFTPRGRPTASDIVAVLRTALRASERALSSSM